MAIHQVNLRALLDEPEPLWRRNLDDLFTVFAFILLPFWPLMPPQLSTT